MAQAPGTAVPGTTVPASSLVATGGAQGAQGILGPPGPAPSTVTTADFTVPAPGATVNVTVQDASWVIIGSMLTVQTAGGSPSQAASLRCTAKTGNQLTLLYQPPTTVPLASVSGAGLLAQVSGNTTDYIGGDNSPHPLFLPTGEYYDQDDFLNMGAAATNIWISKLFACQTNGGAGAVASSISNNYIGHPGVLQLAPGTTTGSWSRAIANAANFFMDGNMTLKIQGIMGVGSSMFAGPNQFFFGLSSSPGPVLSTAGWYAGFLAIASGYISATNWTYYVRNSTVALSQVDTGVAVGSTLTFHKFTISFSATQIVFYIDDVQVGAVSDNSIPVGTALMVPAFVSNNGGAGTNNYSLLVDCFDILATPTIPSGQSSTRFQRRIL